MSDLALIQMLASIELKLDALTALVADVVQRAQVEDEASEALKRIRESGRKRQKRYTSGKNDVTPTEE